MATVTKGRTFTSGETVTPAKLNDVVDLATVTDIQTADIADGQVTVQKLAATLDLSTKTVTLPDTSVTLAKLVTAVQESLLPAGAVQAFAMNSAPAGWLAADGSNVNRTTYAALFSALGTTYGAGDGSTTFALPDLRGYFVRGSGTNSDGTAAGTFGGKQADELKSHSHGFSGYSRFLAKSTSPTPQNNLWDGLGNRTTFATGGTETRPKNIAMLYCIKF